MTGNATTLEGTGPFHPTFGPTLPRSINSWRLSSAPHPGGFTSSLNAELPQTAAGTTGSFLSTSLDQETWATLSGMHCVACRTLNSPATPKTWNWDDYVSAHVTEHNIIKGLIAHGYAGIDNIIKVSYLCNRIKSFALAPVHAMTLADGLLGHDFTQCVTLFADYIHHDKLSSTREVATMGTDDGNHDTLRIKQRKQGRERGFRGKPGGKPLPRHTLKLAPQRNNISGPRNTSSLLMWRDTRSGSCIRSAVVVAVAEITARANLRNSALRSLS